MSILAFIPARGGSKGIPHKNLVNLGGKPLIEHTIAAAKKSKYIDDIFISSDDIEIIEFCQTLNLNVPYKRPSILATDTASMVDTVCHALEWIRKSKCLEWPDDVLLLQPTSPLRSAADIDSAIEIYVDSKAGSLVSVHEMTQHPYECIKTFDNGWEFLQKSDPSIERRQDYPHNYFFINGAIYITKSDLILTRRTFISEGETEIYVMPPKRGYDIDTFYDLKVAEALLDHE